MADQPMTTSDVARALQLSESHVRHLEKTGVLPASKTASGLRVFAAADVARVAEARAQHRGGRGR